MTEDVVRQDQQELYTPSPLFRVLSPLAEGADRLMAKKALALGYELQVILPMQRDEYKKDFPTLLLINEFEDLLGQASAVFEISAANPQREHAYADASRVMLNHSDLLIVLWDGVETGSVAGTAATIRMANESHIPTLRINSNDPSDISLIKDGYVSREWKKGIQRHLETILLPEKKTTSKSRGKISDFAKTFFKQKATARKKIPNLEKLFTGVVEKMPPCFKRETNQKDEHPPVWTAPLDEDWVRNMDYFDDLSGHYSSKYRSCLLLRFSFPVIAIIFLIMALNGGSWLTTPDHNLIRILILLFFVAQIVMLLSTIILELLDKRVMWHKKFYSYRVMAELLRQTVFLWPIGFSDVRYRHRTYRDSDHNWTTWYYRARVRESGLPSITLTVDRLRDWMHWVQSGFINEQIGYHTNRSKRENNITLKLFRAGLFLFGLGILASIARAYTCGTDAQKPLWIPILGGLALLFPSLAVFCTGFCSYAGYPTNHQVSLETKNCLNAIQEDLNVVLGHNTSAGHYKLPGNNTVCYTHALEFTERIHTCCTEELMDWEALIRAKGIKCN